MLDQPLKCTYVVFIALVLQLVGMLERILWVSGKWSVLFYMMSLLVYEVIGRPIKCISAVFAVLLPSAQVHFIDLQKILSMLGFTLGSCESAKLALSSSHR